MEKLSLKELKIQSFVTTIDGAKALKGGGEMTNIPQSHDGDDSTWTEDGQSEIPTMRQGCVDTIDNICPQQFI